MCLAIPARVIELLQDDRARIELGGVHKVMSTDLVDAVVIGDYLIVHVGYAIGKLDPIEVAEPLALLAAIGEVIADSHQFVQMETVFGGRRMVDWINGEQLPRIC